MVFATFLVLPMLLGGGALRSAEVDHFSTAHIPLVDSQEALNQFLNERLALALKHTEMNCDENNLYDTLEDHFYNIAYDQWTHELVEKKIGNQITIAVKDSAYRDFRRIALGESTRAYPLARIFSIDGIRFGSDKIDHIMSVGYIHFEDYYRKNKPLSEVLTFGWDSEHGIWGKWVSGVISYADLLANFNGMRFWNHILQGKEDLLGENLGPYVQCRENHWAQVKSVDIRDYIDHGFDESINCSRMEDEELLTSFKQQISPLTCPRLPNVIKPLWDKYGRFAPHLLNFYGLNSLESPYIDQTVYLSPSQLSD